MEQPLEPRYDENGRRLCSAHSSRTGELCRGPAMKGQTVCRSHGGASRRSKAAAKLRLAELVDPAIATLAREMVQAGKSADKQRAANSILDRAGFPRASRVEQDDARAVLIEKLRRLRGEDPEGDGVLDDDIDDADPVTDG